MGKSDNGLISVRKVKAILGSYLKTLRSADYYSDSAKACISGVLSVVERDIMDLPTIEQPQWISCAERLPEKDVDVLCRSNKCGNCIFIGYIGHKSGAWIDDGVMHVGDVTHWMPLPQPPKGDE